MLIGNPEGMRAYKEGRYLCLRRTNFHPARFLLRIVIFVLHQSVEDEGVERDNHDRQHRRHRDMNEPPDDPQASECEPRDITENSAPEDADPRIHRNRADDQVDDAPDEQDRDEHLDIETTLRPGAVGELRDREQDVEAAQYEHHNRSVREPAGTPHRWGSLSPLFHHFFLSPAPAVPHGCPFRAAGNGAGIAYIGLASPLCLACAPSSSWPPPRFLVLQLEWN